MKRRILSLLTALAMVMSFIGIAPTATNAEDITTISTAADLVAFRDSVNGGNTYEGKTVTLTADIDLSSVCGENIDGAEVSWTPIGKSSNIFKGKFDGDNHKITGLYINAPSNDYQGLFGRVGSDGELKNLGAHGTVTGNDDVGGVVGDNNGTITNCYSNCTVIGNRNVGGVVGRKADGSGIMSGCYNTGAVTGNNIVGGVLGFNLGTVMNCYNTGTVTGTSNTAGGVVGNNSFEGNSVTNCYNIGTVTDGNIVGGVIGIGSSNVTSCYYLVDTARGGINGIDTVGMAQAVATDKLKDQSVFDGWDFETVWTMSAAHGRPILTAIPEPEPEPHFHDMSVECEVGGNAVNFDHALTSQDGKLYIDGAVLEPTVEGKNSYTDLPEGNYYLAEDVTLANLMKIKGDVNLCLNAHKLDMGEECIIVEKTTNGTAMGNLSLCDCGEGGKITSSYYNASLSQTATIKACYEFSMYGGVVENTAANTHSKAVIAFDGTVRLYGGEVVSHNDSAVMADFNTGSSLHLSGEPVITGAADKADIYLDNNYSARIITLDAPLTNTTPYRVAADCENVFTSGWSEQMGTAAFSDYFVSATEGKFIAKDENNELAFVDYAITEQPSAANNYTVTANGAPASYQWYGAEVVTEAVTDQNASVYEAYYNTSSYNSETGLWTGAEKGMNTYYFQDLDLSKGDIVKVTPSESLNNVYAYLSGDNSYVPGTKTTNADGEYVFTAVADDKYKFYFSDYYSDIPSIKATVTKTNKGEAVAGQTKAQFTGGISGTYLCEVSYADGTVLRSDVFDYTAPEPSPSPSATPTATPDTNPSPSPTAAPDNAFSIKYKDGKAVVTAKQDGKYTVIFASYDGSGKLLSVSAEDKTLQKGENEPIAPAEDFTTGARVKVMLWDSLKGMTPLCGSDGN